MVKMPHQSQLEPISPAALASAPAAPVSDWRAGLPLLDRQPGRRSANCRSSDAPALCAPRCRAEQVTRFLSPPPPTVEGFRGASSAARDSTASGGTVRCALPSCRTGRTRPSALFQVRALEPAFGTAEWGFAHRRPSSGAPASSSTARASWSTSPSTCSASTVSRRARPSRTAAATARCKKLGAVQEGVLRRSFSEERRIPGPGAVDHPAATSGSTPRSGLGLARHPPLTSTNMVADMDVRDFDFDLPPELIAQEPPAERGGSRLLVLHRATGALEHTRRSRRFPTLLAAAAISSSSTTRECFRRGCSAAACRAAAPWSACSSADLRRRSTGRRSCIRDRS